MSWTPKWRSKASALGFCSGLIRISRCATDFFLPGNLVAVNLGEIESAGHQRFILDSNHEGIVCEALVAIAEPAQDNLFLGGERTQLRKA